MFVTVPQPEIPEYTSDPTSPTPGDVWVLITPLTQVGSPIGLLLGLTYATIQYTYQLSYYTTENTIERTVIS